MTFKRPFRIAAVVLVVFALAYIAIGVIYAVSVSNREENYHANAVANAAMEPPTEIEWMFAKFGDPTIEWTYRSQKDRRYEIRIYDDGRYLSAFFGSMSYGVPSRYVEGKLSNQAKKSLASATDKVYQNYRDLMGLADKKSDNVKLRVVHANGQRISYSYNTDQYHDLPVAYRLFDTRLFEAMTDWPLKPHHGYTRKPVAISYDADALPALSRGLALDREDLAESIVERLVDIGEPARDVLANSLRSGAAQGYKPTSHYAVVLNGLGKLIDVAHEDFGLIKAVATDSSKVPGRIKLQEQAQGIVDHLEIEAYLDATWPISADTVAYFRSPPLAAEEREAVRIEILRAKTRVEAAKAKAMDKLATMGPRILPDVLAQLQRERQEQIRISRSTPELLALLGGHEAVFYAIRAGVLTAPEGVRSLQIMGKQGLTGLLLLLEAEDADTLGLSTHALAKQEFAEFVPRFVAELNNKLDSYPGVASPAVRKLKLRAAAELIKVIAEHDTIDPDAQRALLRAASDPQLDDKARIAALRAIAALGSAAGALRPELEKLTGYASGRVYDQLVRTLEGVEVIPRVEP